MDLFNGHRPGHQFEPSAETKELWLLTRKLNYQHASINFPGLFNVHKYSLDQGFFIMAIIFEIIGLLFILFKVKSIILGIALALALFIIDIILAFLSHRPYKKVIFNKNKLIQETDLNQKVILQKDIDRAKTKSKVGFSGIILIAIIKFFVYVAAWGFKLNAITILVILSYAIVAYVHINHSGYFFSAFHLSQRLKKEFNKFLEGQYFQYHINNPYQLNFNTNIDIKPGNAGNLSIQKNQNEYTITSNGILYDNEIKTLMNKQTNANSKDELGKKCMELQLTILANTGLVPERT